MLSRFRYEIIAVILLKVVLLFLLWEVCFSHAGAESVTVSTLMKR